MKLRFFRWMVIVPAGLALLTAGCASSLTSSSPRQTTIVEGEKHLSGTVELQFDAFKNPGDRRLRLTQTPMCREMISRETVSRKQLHGVLPAIIEIGFFGLGILDLVVANAIVTNSENRTPIEDVPTGKMVPCAVVQPAADQQVIFQFSGTNTLQYGLTDANGMVELDAPPSPGETAYTNVFVRTGAAKRFAGAVWLMPAP
ncbi:MAG: hypothetical protein KQI81_05735 [Deltaproteobacteria bacterium]|nr:hypothetical protein [Deltaproteobacteria bacterium]